jgi:prolyl oligopeptidase
MAPPLLTLGPVLAAAVMFAAAMPVMAATSNSPSTTPGAPDPFAWLEDIHGARALAWVAAQNARTAAVLESDPRYDTFHRQALDILTAEDRIPDPEFLGGHIQNFWQDATHVKGVWRRTTPASYASRAPAWETLLDLDALSKSEGKNWIFKGDQCLAPADRLCLVRLSDGGGDAVEIREYDTRARAFVAGGFHFDSGKQDVAWLDADTLLVARDWGPGTLTQSGYPFVIKRLKRGQSPADAVEVYRGAPEDVGVSSRVFRDADGEVAIVVLERHVGFFETDYVVLGADGATHPLDLPKKSDVQGYLAGRLIVSLNQDWVGGAAGPAFAAGSLVAVDPGTGAASLIVRPTATQTIDAVAVTASRVLVKLLDDVSGALDVYAPDGGGWTRRRLALPTGSALKIAAADHGSDHAYVSAESFLAPTTLWAVDAAAGTIAKVKRLTPRFDASRDTLEQHFAVSADGTRVPYFLVRPKAMRLDGATPTLMFGYGGFQVSETPTYHPELGKLWLERGGAYVLANIRGGGEFGPAWHEAARRENRQRAFDDFAAVARDLIARRITSPRRLGIYGRSNGGVLTSVSITQHPELFHAAVIESPLIDMLRYNHLSAGASWVAEYGDPDVPADRAFIAAYSAYTRLRPGVDYPDPYITTNTEDDRVHPGHARKFAAALEALGAPYLYYENTFGGHANNADPELNARRWARHYVYLARRLMD